MGKFGRVVVWKRTFNLKTHLIQMIVHEINEPVKLLLCEEEKTIHHFQS